MPAPWFASPGDQERAMRHKALVEIELSPRDWLMFTSPYPKGTRLLLNCYVRGEIQRVVSISVMM